MRKQLWAFVLIAAILVSCATPACAWKDAKDHYRDLELVLFGGELTSADRTGAIKLIEYASALALDQVNGKMGDYFKVLTENGVRELPGSISDFDFNLFGGNHQSYTHRGWEFNYVYDKAHWPIRKNILLATVEHVFDFQWLTGNILGIDFGYDKRCDSFCAIVYYVHVLGDHLSRESYKVDDIIMPLGVAHPSDSNRDVYYELERHLSILFEDQQSTHKYTSLMQELGSLAADARQLAGSTGGIDTDEEFIQYKENANKLIEVLSLYIPYMLKEEAFF